MKTSADKHAEGSRATCCRAQSHVHWWEARAPSSWGGGTVLPGLGLPSDLGVRAGVGRDKSSGVTAGAGRTMRVKAPL